MLLPLRAAVGSACAEECVAGLAAVDSALEWVWAAVWGWEEAWGWGWAAAWAA